MRRKKQKHTRRTVSFYKVNYNLHEPFKVCLQHVGLAERNTHLRKQKPAVCGCLWSWLAAFTQTWHALACSGATRRQLHSCNTEQRVSAWVQSPPAAAKQGS